MDLHLKGKRALVTGAGKGIGRAVAEALGRERCNLVLVARTRPEISAVAAALEEQFAISATVEIADLSEEDERQRLAEAVGDVDILINNAGAIPGGEIDQILDETWRAAWELKVFGYISLTRRYYESMKKRGDGVIVNVIGNAGEKPNPRYIAGTTGNAGLIAFTRALGARAPDFGVRVVGLNPGLTATDRATEMLRNWSLQKFGDAERWEELQKELDLPFGRMGTPEEVADTVVFLASPRASYVSGTIVTVDGGASYRS